MSIGKDLTLEESRRGKEKLAGAKKGWESRGRKQIAFIKSRTFCVGEEQSRSEAKKLVKTFYYYSDERR